MDRPKVGVGIFIVRDGKVLMGQRKGSHGESTWSLPGGHLELFESLEDCAKREVMEETGLTVSDIVFLTATNDIFKEENKHYITLFVKALNHGGTPNIMEPEFCSKWDWFSWDKLPEPLFLPIKNLIDAGFTPFN